MRNPAPSTTKRESARTTPLPARRQRSSEGVDTTFEGGFFFWAFLGDCLIVTFLVLEKKITISWGGAKIIIKTYRYQKISIFFSKKNMIWDSLRRVFFPPSVPADVR